MTTTVQFIVLAVTGAVGGKISSTDVPKSHKQDITLKGVEYTPRVMGVFSKTSLGKSNFRNMGMP